MNGGLIKKIEQLNSIRQPLLAVMGLSFLAILGASIFVSANFGYFLMVCLALAMMIAPFLGRYWCSWLCPRGSFLEFYMRKITRRKAFPSFFKKTAFIWLVVAIFMTMMSVNFLLLYEVYGPVAALGITLTRLLVISTIVAIALGALYEPRVWCVFCPGGTFAKVAAGFRPRWPDLTNDENRCTSCNHCQQQCHFHIDASRPGIVRDADCLKCSECIRNCPEEALRFSEEIKG